MSDRKDLAGKPEVLSFPYAALKAWCAVREYGRKKYGNCNTWMESQPLTGYWNYLNAAGRHVISVEILRDRLPIRQYPIDIALYHRRHV